MKDIRLTFTPEAAKLLSRLHPESKKFIKEGLTELRQNPHLGDDLQQELSGFKSYKIRRYRILYDINEEEGVIQVYYVGHRRDVYEQFRDLLNNLHKSSK
ncbi:MAG: type II toxin-antitoxin system mRNA interferase toxin, RelE/StbE family [Desulfobacterales bacterium]|jgi:mRNA interferase RelE/StbE|nr:type II toxin-antitoxin system mRNA interferase toxin, RelE/StbE family [Desulfobacterales bacterium]